VVVFKHKKRAAYFRPLVFLGLKQLKQPAINSTSKLKNRMRLDHCTSALQHRTPKFSRIVRTMFRAFLSSTERPFCPTSNKRSVSGKFKLVRHGRLSCQIYLDHQANDLPYDETRNSCFTARCYRTIPFQALQTCKPLSKSC